MLNGDGSSGVHFSNGTTTPTQANGNTILKKKCPSTTADFINPFVHKLNLSTCQRIKIFLLTITIFPIRLLLVGITFTLVVIIGNITTAFLTKDDLKKPFSGWRKRIAIPVFLVVARAVFFFGGYMWVTSTGRRSTRKEAPIMVMAPHSSFLDALVVVCLGLDTVVGKTETASSIIGSVLRVTQPILVSREDPNSRQGAVQEIKRRCASEEDWPQISIFPEGTCTNRTCLINFKLGAFAPGVPVQPVIIRYPNFVDTVTWTWDGPGVFTLLWLSMSQFHNRLSIDYLPIYHPSPEERSNPSLFAENIRRIMSKALVVPVTNLAYEDCRLMTLAKKHGLPMAGSIVEFAEVNRKLEASYDSWTAMLDQMMTMSLALSRKITLPRFAEYVGQPVSAAVKKVFAYFEKEESGDIDLRDYVTSLYLLTSGDEPEEALKFVFKMYTTPKLNAVPRAEFLRVIGGIFSLQGADQLLPSQEHITFDEFWEACGHHVELFSLYHNYRQEFLRSSSRPAKTEAKVLANHLKCA